MRRAMTREDSAIFAARVTVDEQRAYAKAHMVDVAASAKWFKRRGYVDIRRRVACLGIVESFWEIARKHPRQRTH